MQIQGGKFMSTSLPQHFEDFAEARREGFLKVKVAFV